MKTGALITARVPGTTANLGPGFDTLGIALQLYNRVRVEVRKGTGVEITSPIAETARPGATALLDEAAALFFKTAGIRRAGLAVSLTGDVPIARGLGSSVTARLGLVGALNRLAGDPLDLPGLLRLVTQLEHHPDNAAPALLGGFTVAGMRGGEVAAARFRVDPALRFVALIPDFEVSTEKARGLLPGQFSRSDTVHSLNRAALITARFAQRDYEGLKGLFEDRLHQPYRQPLIPQLPEVIRGGVNAGAIGGWLSGSGSTIICMTLEDPEGVGRAMRRRLPNAEIRILKADNHGFKIE